MAGAFVSFDIIFKYLWCSRENLVRCRIRFEVSSSNRSGICKSLSSNKESTLLNISCIIYLLVSMSSMAGTSIDWNSVTAFSKKKFRNCNSLNLNTMITIFIII